MTRGLSTLLSLLLIVMPAAAVEPEFDAFSGFPNTVDWEIVMAIFIACHSTKLITQQRGSAEQWLSMIRWMQAKQNLWQFDPDVERRIVAWLAENYPPSEDRRRAPIPPDLMPPNPFAKTTPEPE